MKVLYFLTNVASVFWRANFKSDVHFRRPCPETLDNPEKQGIARHIAKHRRDNLWFQFKEGSSKKILCPEKLRKKKIQAVKG